MAGVWMIWMTVLWIMVRFSSVSPGVVIPPQAQYLGEVKPDDPRVVVGQNVTLTCTLADYSSYTSDTLSFSWNAVRIDDSKITVLDNRTISYHIDVVTMSDAGTYRCMIRLPRRHPIFVQFQYLEVLDSEPDYETTLPPPDTLDCESDNYDNLTCSWFPKELILGAANWDSTYWLETFDGLNRCEQFRGLYTCHVCGREHPHVYCDNKNPSFNTGLEYYIRVIPQHDLKNQPARMYRVIPSLLVKPGPVIFNSNINVASRHAFLTWEPPAGWNIGMISLVYNINITQEDQPVITRSNLNERSFNATNLRPDREYQANITAKPSEAGYLSDPVSKDWKTYEDAPDAPLTVFSGSFRIRQLGTLDSRQLDVFWQKMNPDTQNGRLINCSVTVRNTGTGAVKDHSTVCDEEAYSIRDPLQMQYGYEVTLKAYTKVGPSPPANLRIPPHSQLPGYAKHVEAETLNDSCIQFWWTAADSSIVQHTLYQCLSKDIEKCQGMEAVQVVNHTGYIMNINQVHSYSISSETTRWSSGMPPEWICVYSHKHAPVQVQFRKASAQERRSLTVAWDKLICNRGFENGRAEEIHIEWSCFNGTADVNGSDVLPGNSTMYTIRPVHPYTNISVSMWSKGVGGKSEVSLATLQSDEAEPDDPPREVTVGGVTSDAVVISWLPPVIPNGVITHYTVKLSQKEGNTITENTINTTWYREGLPGYTNYTVTVTSFTSAGPSPMSQPVHFRTKIGIPSSVRDVRGRSIPGNNQRYHLNVTWQPPAQPNGPIESYEVTATWEGKRLPVSNVSVPGDRTTVLLSDIDCHLKPSAQESKIIAHVRAKNRLNQYSRPANSTDISFCNFSETIPGWVVAVAVCSLLVVLLLATLVIRWCTVRVKNWFSWKPIMPPDVEMPETDLSKDENYFIDKNYGPPPDHYTMVSSDEQNEVNKGKNDSGIHIAGSECGETSTETVPGDTKVSYGRITQECESSPQGGSTEDINNQSFSSGGGSCDDYCVARESYAGTEFHLEEKPALPPAGEDKQPSDVSETGTSGQGSMDSSEIELSISETKQEENKPLSLNQNNNNDSSDCDYMPTLLYSKPVMVETVEKEPDEPVNSDNDDYVM